MAARAGHHEPQARSIQTVDPEFINRNSDVILRQLLGRCSASKVVDDPLILSCRGVIRPQDLHSPPSPGFRIAALPRDPEVASAELVCHLEPTAEEVADVERVESPPAVLDLSFQALFKLP
ncbi:hypothetical protein DL771_010269 [Monosporascus sp. 5C6A]|nr:hypothetical protein DL771_010269 [Monosporascus sp. 5C6A]